MNKLLILLASLSVGLFAFGQGILESWKVSMREQYGIVKNTERFNDFEGEEILYFAERGEQKFLFTENAVIIRQPEESSPQEKYERHERQEKGLPVSMVHFSTFALRWNNNVPATKLEPQDPYSFSYNYQSVNNSSQTVRETPYGSLVYKNIYDQIDLRFYLPDEGGLKYEFIIYPGGDPGDIQTTFEGAEIEINSDGEIAIAASPIAYTDKAPKSWCQSSEKEVPISFKQAGQQVTFEVGSYDLTETLIIDPWLVAGLPFIEVQQAYDVGIDRQGNVSILGEHGNQIALYDNTGALMWVWTSPGELNEFYGGMDMNPYNGDIYYVFMGVYLGVEDVWCLNVDGTVIANKAYIPDYDPGEMWRISYNRITDQVVVGAGGLPRESHLCVLDSDLLINSTYAPLPPSPPNLTDATFLEVDPCGGGVYLLCSGDGAPLYDNVLYKLEMADPATVIWETPTGHDFEEISCIAFMGYEVMTGEGPDWYSANGHNGIACSYDLYTYDDDSLFRWNKATGELIDAISISPVDLGPPWGDLTYCGGIDTDVYGNVYLADIDVISKYTQDLVFLEDIPLPDTCYDLRIEGNLMTASGRDFVQTFELSGLPEVDFEMSMTPQPCGSCDGTATVSDFTSSAENFSFAGVEWSPSGQTTTTATELCIGWHTATVYFTNGLCDSIAKTDSIEVVLGAPGTFNVETEDESCGESCDGSVTVTVDEGFPPFTYDLDGEVNGTGAFEDLCPGEYELVVTDDDGCTYEELITIGAGDSIDVDMIVLDEACPGACNGSITLEPTSGDAPYYFEFDGVADADGVLEDLCVGTHTIFVSDSGGCAFVGTAVVETGESMGLDTVTVNNPSCNGFSDGSATVSTELGEEPVTYVWVPENPVPGATYNTMGAGIYTVYAEDVNGCKDTLTFEIVEPDSIYAEISITDPLCFGDSTGYVVVDSVYNPQGNPDGITYIWSPDPPDVSGVGNDSIYNLFAGTYTLTVNDEAGCSNALTFSVNHPPAITFSEFGYHPAFCRLYDYQSGNGVVFAAANGGVPDYEYEWLDLQTMETTTTSTWGGRNSGNYQVTVTDNNGCVLIETIFVDSLNPIADFIVDSEQLNNDYVGTEVVEAVFTNLSQNFANPYDAAADTTFYWSFDHPNANWQVSHDFFEMFDTSYVGEAVYDVCLIATNKNGCADTTCKALTVHVQPEFVAPNIFTPGNGANDVFTFEFRTVGIAEFHCVIVNRWGNTVAELKAITDGWDGSNLSGETCPDGVYFYTYEAVATNGTVFKGQGNVQLVGN